MISKYNFPIYSRYQNIIFQYRKMSLNFCYTCIFPILEIKITEIQHKCSIFANRESVNQGIFHHPIMSFCQKIFFFIGNLNFYIRNYFLILENMEQRACKLAIWNKEPCKPLTAKYWPISGPDHCGAHNRSPKILYSDNSVACSVDRCFQIDQHVHGVTG